MKTCRCFKKIVNISAVFFAAIMSQNIISGDYVNAPIGGEQQAMPFLSVESHKKIEQFCEKNKPYQDVVIDGQVIYSGWNSQYCAKRYEIVQDSIKKIYANEFAASAFSDKCPNLSLNILDLGAAQGYFSFRLAHDYGFTCCMVEDGQSATTSATIPETMRFLADLCKQNSKTTKVFLLESIVDRETLEAVHYADHFNIILALSVIHLLEDWRACVDLLMQTGDFAIIELPNPGDGDLSEMANADKLEDMHNYIAEKGGLCVAHTSRFYKGQTSTFYLLRGCTSVTSPCAHRLGISLYSFIRLNGRWPQLKPEFFASIDNQCLSHEILIQDDHTAAIVEPCQD